MLQISSIQLPSCYKAHTLCVHPTRPLIAVAANCTVFIYENADFLSSFSCSSVPVLLSFSYNRLSIACASGELIVVSYEQERVTQRYNFDERIVALLSDSVVLGGAIVDFSGYKTVLPEPAVAACDFVGRVLFIGSSGYLYECTDGAAVAKMRVDGEAFSMVGRADQLVIGCRDKLVVVNEAFEVVRDIKVDFRVESFAASDAGDFCCLDADGHYRAVQ